MRCDAMRDAMRDAVARPPRVSFAGNGLSPSFHHPQLNGWFLFLGILRTVIYLVLPTPTSAWASHSGNKTKTAITYTKAPPLALPVPSPPQWQKVPTPDSQAPRSTRYLPNLCKLCKGQPHRNMKRYGNFCFVCPTFQHDADQVRPVASVAHQAHVPRYMSRIVEGSSPICSALFPSTILHLCFPICHLANLTKRSPIECTHTQHRNSDQ